MHKNCNTDDVTQITRQTKNEKYSLPWFVNYLVCKSTTASSIKHWFGSFFCIAMVKGQRSMVNGRFLFRVMPSAISYFSFLPRKYRYSCYREYILLCAASRIIYHILHCVSSFLTIDSTLLHRPFPVDNTNIVDRRSIKLTRHHASRIVCLHVPALFPRVYFYR